MPHINRHQQRALPLRGAHPHQEPSKAKNKRIRQIEDRESKDEIKYWESRAWVRR